MVGWNLLPSFILMYLYFQDTKWVVDLVARFGLQMEDDKQMISAV
jgi:hypothetical protein